jgi:hypothetical protein
MRENGLRGSARSDDRASDGPVAPPEKRHVHQFASYDARGDRWVCRCGASWNRLDGLWKLGRDGGQQVDAGVRSGRERLTW